MKILIVDDDALTRLALHRLLTDCGWHVITATNGEEAYDLMQREEAARLVIIDWVMPGMSGPELCRKLRESERTSRTHIVMLTGHCTTDYMVTGLDAGADDFISKPFNMKELQARIRAAERLIGQQDELLMQASLDELTRVLNRTGIRDAMNGALAHAAQERKPISIVLADVDRFKQVNDTYGHPVGDAVLRGVACRLAARLRPCDNIGRYGGEEFLIILPSCNPQDAMDVAERVRVCVSSEPIVTPAGALSATVSLGVAGGYAHRVSIESLISEADKALYRAKHAGRNRVQGPHMSTETEFDTPVRQAGI
jgi:diguanylate cyclase (GGDEF)-like protein